MQYAWLIWTLILLGVWLAIYLILDSGDGKREMLAVSLWTSLLGLTEPFFVPEYWSPPSLFNLAAKTGFDIESLIFSFGIGGIAAVLYERIFRAEHVKITVAERLSPRHRWHWRIILSAPVVFLALGAATGMNSIYASAIALAFGGLLALYCRLDLKKKMIASIFLFTGLYFLYFLSLIALYPGYVEAVWNLRAISGILILGVPLEELMFAATFGFFWSGVYEHLKWYKIKTPTKTT